MSKNENPKPLDVDKETRKPFSEAEESTKRVDSVRDQIKDVQQTRVRAAASSREMMAKSLADMDKQIAKPEDGETLLAAAGKVLEGDELTPTVDDFSEKRRMRPNMRVKTISTSLLKMPFYRSYKKRKGAGVRSRGHEDTRTL